MREFIKKSLTDALREGVKGKREYCYQYKRDDNDTISIEGTITKKEGVYFSDFRVERMKANGHRCSAVPVLGMPLTQKTISEITELAVESL